MELLRRILLVLLILCSIDIGKSEPEKTYSNVRKNVSHNVDKRAIQLIESMGKLLEVGETVTDLYDFFGEIAETNKAIAYIQFENYYKYSLLHHKYWFESGTSETYPKQVRYGTREAQEVQGEGEGSGLEMVGKYEVKINKKETLDIVYYVKVEQNAFWRDSNRFGIGITLNTGCEGIYKQAKEFEFMDIKDFADESHVITHCYKNLVCVQGTFTSNHHANGRILVIPSQVTDFAEGLIREEATILQEELDETFKYADKMKEIISNYEYCTARGSLLSSSLVTIILSVTVFQLL